MNNLPAVKLGIITVSRDCFPAELARQRAAALMAECRRQNIPVQEIPVLLENEKDALEALLEIQKRQINALVIFLGNFGPEGPTTILAQRFAGPVMLAAAAEERGDNLIQGRGDAYCGLLNSSYNAALRGLRPYIPHYPVGTAPEIAEKIAAFIPAARIVMGLKRLKIFAFGPRPQDFYACNAPIKPLFDLGVEVMENSELDLYDVFNKVQSGPEIEKVVQEMTKELGKGNSHPDLLEKLARYEVGLKRFMEENLGASQFGVFANKCWPSFESYFGFVPCYVNSRFASRGIPIACEVDIYGALSEYMALCASGSPATLLDINNSVPQDMFAAAGNAVKDYTATDLFMGFHCGNTPSSCLLAPQMKHQLIMKRLMEPDSEPDITRGTLEGRLKTGGMTIYRLQSSADTRLKAYIAEGEVLDIDPRSFGSIGVCAIKEMGRFYRYILIAKNFPHHTSLVFYSAGQALFSALKMLGINEVFYNQPAGVLYPEENPFV